MRHCPDRSASGPVVVFSDEADWHQERLVSALRGRGLAPVVARLSDVAFEIGGRVPLTVPGCGGALPRAALVRGIAPGSFEAVSLRLGVLHGLAEMGITVWNAPRAIERCVDKAATSLALVRAGLPTPRTLVTESRARALEFVARETGRGHRVVSKPLFGAQGRGLALLHRPDDLPPADEVWGVWYLQRFVPPGEESYRDFRVLVSAGRAVAAMVRRSGSWITNVHRGATPEPLGHEPLLERMAEAAAAAVGADFAGVDLIRDPAGGFTVLEVNSTPAWRGLQTVARTDVAARIVDDWLAAAGILAVGEIRPAGTAM